MIGSFFLGDCELFPVSCTHPHGSDAAAENGELRDFFFQPRTPWPGELWGSLCVGFIFCVHGRCRGLARATRGALHPSCLQERGEREREERQSTWLILFGHADVRTPAKRPQVCGQYTKIRICGGPWTFKEPHWMAKRV